MSYRLNIPEGINSLTADEYQKLIGGKKIQNKVALAGEPSLPSLDIQKTYGFTIKHWFDIDPVPAPRMVRSDKWKKRKCVIKYFNFKKNLLNIANREKYELTDTLNVAFIIPMPKSWNERKRALNLYRYHRQKPDRDNLLKALQDAFGYDDSFISDGRTLKIWGEQGAILILE